MSGNSSRSSEAQALKRFTTAFYRDPSPEKPQEEQHRKSKPRNCHNPTTLRKNRIEAATRTTEETIQGSWVLAGAGYRVGMLWGPVDLADTTNRCLTTPLAPQTR